MGVCVNEPRFGCEDRSACLGSQCRNASSLRANASQADFRLLTRRSQRRVTKTQVPHTPAFWRAENMLHEHRCRLVLQLLRSCGGSVAARYSSVSAFHVEARYQCASGTWVLGLGGGWERRQFLRLSGFQEVYGALPAEDERVARRSHCSSSMASR